MRRTIATVLVILLCLCCTVPVYAEEILPQAISGNPQYTPQMEYTIKYHANIAVSEDGVATITSVIYGKNGITTKTSISAELQRYINNQWVTIKFFTTASMSHYAYLQQTYNLVSGYSYRVRATVTAYAEGGAESYLATSEAVFYG